MLTVDEEIYRLTPAFVIATVDKFARLAREGEAASLFGYVSERCGRHGYVPPRLLRVYGQLATRRTAAILRRPWYPVGRMRPPDLIIQDELHLITGALGTAVGLFEVAVETLCSWETPGRQACQAADRRLDRDRAECRRAGARTVRAKVEIFPPQVLDVADTFFSREVPVIGKEPRASVHRGVRTGCAPVKR